ncbi:hypothetical protein PSTT_13967 [Puccinia striiformis]|uniref:Uncharacterized protein n=2 Tax=Puccinia striiformis TaxID=27350 RepID=A0A2S4UPA0_9BASI|nr:hypothetical protein PSTT_13967 [Puccinia striiformis]
MKTVLKANLATYLVIALTVLCAHLTEAKSKAVAGVAPRKFARNPSKQAHWVVPRFYAKSARTYIIHATVTIAAQEGIPVRLIFDLIVHKMTWHKCGQPTATGAAGAQVKTVTGTLTYAIDHAVNVMGVRGTEPGVSGDHYYECSLAQNPQRSRCTGCHYQKLGPP